MTVKALNGIQWEVAPPLTLNYGTPITSMDAAICVSGESCIPSPRSNRGS